jgi:hypothetical protein
MPKYVMTIEDDEVLVSHTHTQAPILVFRVVRFQALLCTAIVRRWLLLVVGLKTTLSQPWCDETTIVPSYTKSPRFPQAPTNERVGHWSEVLEEHSVLC